MQIILSDFNDSQSTCTTVQYFNLVLTELIQGKLAAKKTFQALAVCQSNSQEWIDV